MAPPNRVGSNPFSSFSAFMDNIGHCLDALVDGVDAVVEAPGESIEAFNFAFQNFSTERGLSGFVDDYLWTRQLQEFSHTFAPILRGMSARSTPVSAAGVGPLVTLETGARICSVPDPSVDCSIMSAPDCELFCAPEGSGQEIHREDSEGICERIPDLVERARRLGMDSAEIEELESRHAELCGAREE